PPEGAALTSPAVADAYLAMEPSTTDFGCTTPPTCPNPPNGGIANTGARFVLDMFVNAQEQLGSAMQGYVTYTFQVADLADVTALPTSCVLVQAARADLTTFDSNLQNEWCNGPQPCFFRGVQSDPGWGAYAAGALNTC